MPTGSNGLARKCIRVQSVLVRALCCKRRSIHRVDGKTRRHHWHWFVMVLARWEQTNSVDVRRSRERVADAWLSKLARFLKDAPTSARTGHDLLSADIPQAHTKRGQGHARRKKAV